MNQCTKSTPDDSDVVVLIFIKSSEFRSRFSSLPAVAVSGSSDRLLLHRSFYTAEMVKIVGKYKMESSEGFDEFMKALGMYGSLKCFFF